MRSWGGFSPSKKAMARTVRLSMRALNNCFRILYLGTLREGQSCGALEHFADTYNAVERPNSHSFGLGRLLPLHFIGDGRASDEDNLPQSGQGLASPATRVPDDCVDLLRNISRHINSAPDATTVGIAQ